MTVWLGGSAPVALTRDSDLPKDARHFWEVDFTLRSIGGAPVWGLAIALHCETFRVCPRRVFTQSAKGPCSRRICELP